MTVWQAIIKVNTADDPNRRALYIQDGIGYACALLMDEYGWSADNVRGLLERITDEAEDRAETSPVSEERTGRFQVTHQPCAECRELGCATNGEPCSCECRHSAPQDRGD